MIVIPLSRLASFKVDDTVSPLIASTVDSIVNVTNFGSSIWIILLSQIVTSHSSPSLSQHDLS